MFKNLFSKNIYLIVMGLCISFCYGVFSSYASENHEHEKRQLDSHEHGVSTLNIALEGQNIQMKLESPANDIVGFEHSPKSNKQKADVKRALSLLREPNGVFILSSKANCKIESNEAEFEVKKGESETHAAFHVTWKVTCSNPKRLTSLETTFFKLFPKAKEIEVKIISGSGQKAIEWENNMKKIKLQPLLNDVE